MGIKSNKGITLIALIITIIVILIISTITVYTGSNIVDEAKFEDVKTNMLLVEAEIKNFAEQAKFENKKIEDFTKGDGIENDKGVKLKLGDPEEVDGETFYKIITDMSKLNLDKIDPENYLVLIDIDKLVVDVYFKPGISNGDGVPFNFLSEIKSYEEFVKE